MPENRGSFISEPSRHAKQRHVSAAANPASGSSTKRVKKRYPALKKNFIPFMGFCQSRKAPSFRCNKGLESFT
jgi:hypothetical protein